MKAFSPQYVHFIVANRSAALFWNSVDCLFFWQFFLTKFFGEVFWRILFWRIFWRSFVLMNFFDKHLTKLFFYVFFYEVFYDFLWKIVWPYFFLMNFWQFSYLLTIASFRIGVHSFDLVLLWVSFLPQRHDVSKVF